MFISLVLLKINKIFGLLLTMLNIRSCLVLVSISILLLGCSKDDTPTVSNGSKKAELQSQKADAKSAALSEKGTTKIPTLPEPMKLPTRSEVRVLSEDTKAIENDAKNVIGKFDDNLNNRQIRKEAEAEFKKMLPEYKEKMLLLGKAKLKEAADAQKINSTLAN